MKRERTERNFSWEEIKYLEVSIMFDIFTKLSSLRFYTAEINYHGNSSVLSPKENKSYVPSSSGQTIDLTSYKEVQRSIINF